MRNNCIFLTIVVVIYAFIGYLSYDPAVRFYLNGWSLVTTDLRDYVLMAIKIAVLSAFLSFVVAILFQKIKPLSLKERIRIHVCFFIINAVFFVIALYVFHPKQEMGTNVVVAYSVNNVNLVPYYLSSFVISSLLCVLLRKKW